MSNPFANRLLGIPLPGGRSAQTDRVEHGQACRKGESGEPTLTGFDLAVVSLAHCATGFVWVYKVVQPGPWLGAR